MRRELPSAPTAPEIHERCRASANAAAAVLGDVWIAPRLDRGAGGMLRRDSGDSTEFHDHRLYAPGDDPRRINWAAYGRTGQLSLKLFRQEGRPLIDCMFDVSPSMWQPAEKAERTLELLYFIIASATAQQAGLQIWTLSGNRPIPLPVGLFAIGAKWIERLPPAETSGAAITTDGIPMRPGSHRLLVSDLLFPIDPATLVRPLISRNGSASVLAPWHPTEAEPEWLGTCQLDDSETQTAREVDFDGPVRNAYREAYDRHFSNWEDSCRRHGIAFNRICSGGTLAATLAAGLTTLNPSSTC